MKMTMTNIHKDVIIQKNKHNTMEGREKKTQNKRRETIIINNLARIRLDAANEVRLSGIQHAHQRGQLLIKLKSNSPH